MCSGALARRSVAQGGLSWLVAAAARHDGSRVVALQYAVRPGATGPRSAAVHAGPWLDAVAGEPRGTPARRVAPWPEVLRDGPSRAAPLGAP